MIQIEMEMPESCAECPFAQANVHGFDYRCVINDEDVEDEETGDLFDYRSEWCPLMEVPAH